MRAALKRVRRKKKKKGGRTIATTTNNQQQPGTARLGTRKGRKESLAKQKTRVETVIYGRRTPA